MNTYYIGEYHGHGYSVEYLVHKSNTRLVRVFDSPYLARKFVNRLRHSKKCTLISYPISCM